MTRFGPVLREGGATVLACFLVGTAAALAAQFRLGADLAGALVLLGVGTTVHAHGMARLHAMQGFAADPRKAAHARWLDAALVASAATSGAAIALRLWAPAAWAECAAYAAASSGCLCVYLGLRSLGVVRG